MTVTEATAPETLSFQAEVSRLLEIVAHSLYSEKEIFLRELISNASDACDKLRYAAQTNSSLMGDEALKITLSVDKEAKTLTVADNGIGMSRAELIENLGTIAKSGTAAFTEALKDKKDANLIGQFGVGFYSAFMVADKVTVASRKAGSDEGWQWESDGKGAFTIEPGTMESRGTTIVLHLKADAEEYLEPARLKLVVRKYSDHIAIPVELVGESDALNQASALWMRPKSEITPEQYREFYQHSAHAYEEPWGIFHWRAEGVIEYTALLYVPGAKPFDLYDPRRAHDLKLYVRRVFIADAAEGLLPGWLRFLKGVIDSEDLPLNVSREMLQSSPVVTKIRQGVVKRVLSELAKRADDAESYGKFWTEFGAVMKEGLYEDFEHREELLKLARFRSTTQEGWVSLADYKSRMKEGQEAIFTIAGEDIDKLRQSPQLEGFKARGVEVLLLTDPIDEFWVGTVNEFEGKEFTSVTRAGEALDKIAGEEKPAVSEEEKKSSDTLLALMKTVLGDEVKDVKASTRLTDSPVCLVAAEGDLDINLERLLKQHKQLNQVMKRVLEVNPTHPLIKALAAKAETGGASETLSEITWLLLDQARIAEGEKVLDMPLFVKRMSEVMGKVLA